MIDDSIWQDAEQRMALTRSLTNHTPSPDQVTRIEEIRAAAIDLGGLIIDNAPTSRARSLALTELESATMWAVKAIVLEPRGVSRCKSCGSEIIWAVVLDSGRRMPLDAEPVSGGNVVVVGQGDGPLVRVLGATDEPADGEAYVSHFATCPNADAHRKR